LIYSLNKALKTSLHEGQDIFSPTPNAVPGKAKDDKHKIARQDKDEPLKNGKVCFNLYAVSGVILVIEQIFSGFQIQLTKAPSAPSMEQWGHPIQQNPTSMIGKPGRIFVSQRRKSSPQALAAALGKGEVADADREPKH
jgi:hypothetical protein